MSTAGTQQQEVSSRELLEEIAGNTRVMCVKLFGSSSVDVETDKGRLPVVEAAANRANTRLDDIDKKLAAYAGAIAVIVWAVNHFSAR